MSHFTVMVIGDDYERQLAPYHEYECTGRNDEFVQEIDVTDEIREEFRKSTASQYKDPDGGLHDPYQDRFYRDPTPDEKKEMGPIAGTGCGGGLFWTSKDWGDGRGYRARVHFCPDGWANIEVPTREIQSFREYVEEYHGRKIVPFGEDPNTFDGEHKYGYALEDSSGQVTKIVRRTNPNAHWDWYALGGRWAGFFKLKQSLCLGDRLTEAEIDRLAITHGLERATVVEVAELIKAGKESELIKRPLAIAQFQLQKEIRELLSPVYVNGQVGYSHWSKPPETGWVDQARKGDIDFEGMRADAAAKAAGRYDLLARLFGGEIPEFEPWEAIKDDDIKRRRERYWDQPALRRLSELRKHSEDLGLSEEDRSFLVFVELDEFRVGRQAYVERAALSALCTFAVVKDGKWYERGEMGWWSVVHNDKGKDAWIEELSKLVESVPDDTMLTIVDCHI